MRIVLQRVKRASVLVNEEKVAEIGRGLLLLVGFHKGDTEDILPKMADKCANLRIFEDDQGKMNLSTLNLGLQVLAVSNFTLSGDTRKGRRPSFDKAEKPERANELFEKFYEAYKKGDRDFIENSIEKLTARQYDLVLNGVELGSGSIRIHKKELQLKVFEILGYTKEEVEKRFGFLLEALEYGAPPHGGIALGFDRIVAMILKLESIRDVIPFPKTTSGQALFEKAPSEVEEEQLKELGIKIADK